MSTALGQGLGANPQHMMQFAPLLYSYQMAMAQAAQVAGECPNVLQLCNVVLIPNIPVAFNNNNKKSSSASSSSKNSSNASSLADIQRAAELQRQYLLEMIPPQQPSGPSGSRQNNWKA